MATLEERIALRELELKIEAQKRSAGGVGAERASIKIGNAALAAPSAIGGFLFDTVPSYIAAGAQGLVGSHGDPGMLFGGDFGFSRRLANQEDDKTLLQKGLGNLPKPEVSDVAATVGAIKQNPATGKAFGEAFREDKMAWEQEQLALEEAFPRATKFGDMAGDVATLIGMRAPFSTGMKKFEQKLMNDMFSVAPTKRIRDAHKHILNSKPVRHLARALGRSTEAGLEAAVLDLINGDDPMETAVYASIGQLTGSALLGAAQQTVKGGLAPTGTKILTASLAAGALWQVLKDMTPGGRDSVIDSFEVGFEKVTYALVLGGLAGLSGSGRFRGNTEMTNAAVRVLDGLVALPRTAVISILEEMVDAQPEEQKRMETVLQRLIEAPQGMGEDAALIIEKAIEDGTLNEAVDSLYEKSQQFRDWLDEE